MTLSTADGAKPYDDLSISDIDFVNNEPGEPSGRLLNALHATSTVSR